MQQLTTQQIAESVHGKLLGAGDITITAAQQLDLAKNGDITFIRDQSHAPQWATSNASAAIVSDNLDIQPAENQAVILVKDADVALNIILQHFAPKHTPPPATTHQLAIVDESASIGKNVAIGPGCFVGPNVTIGDNCILHANVAVFDDTVIGQNCELFPGVVIRERCELENNIIIHSNVVIGTDGFGYLPPDPKNPAAGAIKIPHLGTVKIGDNVEIGAGTCIDRGKFGPTTIGAGTKIDNLCQIAHNCTIGRCCMLSGQVGIAGTVTVGDGVIMGGKVAIKDHVTIGNGVTLAGMSAVINNIPDGETWGGTPAQEYRLALRQYAAMRKLPELAVMLKKSKRKNKKNS